MNETQNATGQENILDTRGWDTASVIQIRLDTTPIHEKIELYLRGGQQILAEAEDGKAVIQKIEFAKPLANEEGIRAIMSKVRMVINPATVQGNFDTDMYDYYLQELQIELTREIYINLYDWKINPKEAPSIITNIMALVVPFMSRTINNGERNSFGTSLKTTENNTVVQGNKGFGLFKN